MTLPVYLVHYDAPGWVMAAARTVLESSVHVAVTIIDNGPYDGGLPETSNVRIIRTGSNAGYAAAANIGIEEWLEGDHPYVMVGSHDLLLPPDALDRLLAVADASPRYGIIAPELTNNWMSPVIARDGAIDEREILSGGCMILRRACIEEIGLFDETFISYGEDNDLSARARNAGWKLGTVRGLVVETKGSSHPEQRERLRAAATTLARFRSDGWTGALRGFLIGLRRCVEALRRSQPKTAVLILRGTVEGVTRVVRENQVSSGGPRRR